MFKFFNLDDDDDGDREFIKLFKQSWMFNPNR